MSSIISIENISKKYKKQFALKDVNIEIEKKDIYGLIGKNGAGKSTLLKSLVGMISPTNGKISVQGSHNDYTLALSRNNIGFFIDHSMYPYMNAYENLIYRCKVLGITDAKKEVSRVLDLLKMSGIKKNVKTFSMGMKQRLEIAGALLGYPDIIILDEPLNGLDPEGIFDLKNLILDINRNYDTTFIISSHILSELEVLSNKFSFLHEGILIETLTKEELKKKCQHQLLIKTNDTNKATVILEEKLNTKNYTINAKNEILLSDYVDSPNLVADVIYANGLHLYQLTPYSITLEEFFLKMIGGIQNA
ncbi:MAG: ATP-binding cassette domain-containing protein [Lachnospiraceae bacterium]|jgi:ABC superfamily ATP binding cassette transporter, ABC protein|nr:MAG: ATP-binding cassette domain-containing protein [Lachnospiraceae bacterium]